VNQDLVLGLQPWPGSMREPEVGAAPAVCCRDFEAMLQAAAGACEDEAGPQDEDSPCAGDAGPLGAPASLDANDAALTWSLLDQTLSCLKASDATHSGRAFACLRLKGQILGGSEITLERESGRLQVRIRPGSPRAAGVIRDGLAALQSALEDASPGCAVCIELRTGPA
jgi:hypothetical protein